MRSPVVKGNAGLSVARRRAAREDKERSDKTPVI